MKKRRRAYRRSLTPLQRSLLRALASFLSIGSKCQAARSGFTLHPAVVQRHADCGSVTELGTSLAAAPAGPDARLLGRRLGSAMKPMKGR